MGAWGTAIKSNDTSEDIYNEFFELYNKGENPRAISKKLIADNQELINDPEDNTNFWFALALAQWETKSLDPAVFYTVEDIIHKGKDLQIWRDLDADENDLRKRKTVLDKFLEKLTTEKPKAKARKKSKTLKPIFATGDCLCFKLENGNYGGAVVLAADKSGLNLIASTRINQSTPPTIQDFENATVLLCSFGNWQDKPKITWYFAPLPKNNTPILEVTGTIPVQIIYDSNEYHSTTSFFHPTYSGNWIQIVEMVNRQIEHEKTNLAPKKKLNITQLIRKKKWWQLF